MPGYATLSRLSLIQLHSEDRKQRAHLKKISEMQRRSRLDTSPPVRLPHLNQNFLKKFSEKRHEINKENEAKSKKLLNIMVSKSIRPLAVHPRNQVHRNHTIHSTHNNTEYLERVAKAKGKYDAREWRKQYEQHKQHLRIGKDNRVFTPLGIGINQQRISRSNSSINSKRTTPRSSSLNMFSKYDKNARI